MLRARPSDAARAAGPLVAGVLLLAAVTALGQDGGLLALATSPPLFVRVALSLAATLFGFVLLSRGIERLDRRSEPATMVRGVRLLFLAVGAFAVAAGWLTGVAVAIAVGLIIAAVDVVETSFLLLVTATRPNGHDID